MVALFAAMCLAPRWARFCLLSLCWAFGAIIPLPVAPALHPGVLALGDRLRSPDRACLCVMAAGAGARHFGSPAVLLRPGCRGAQLAAAALPRCDGGNRRVARHTRGHDHHDCRVALFFVVAAAVVFVLLRLIALGDDGAGATHAAPALDGVAAGHRQYSPPRRADAKRDVVARARPGVARHRGPDRRQSSPRTGRCAAGESAVVLLPRYSGCRCGPFRCLRACPGAPAQAPARADAAWPHRRGKRRAGGGTQAGGRLALGAAR